MFFPCNEFEETGGSSSEWKILLKAEGRQEDMSTAASTRSRRIPCPCCAQTRPPLTLPVAGEREYRMCEHPWIQTEGNRKIS